MAIKTHDFYYELPPELIAQTPIQRRDASRLLTLDKRTGEIGHHHFYDLPQFLRPGDCLVLNDSRVLPARLLGRREPTGEPARWCFSLTGEKMSGSVWSGLEKKLREGAKLSFGDGALTAEVTAVLEGGNRLIRFTYEGIFLELLERLGEDAVAALYQRRTPGCRTVSDGLFSGGWLCGSPYGGPAFYQRSAGFH